MRKKRLANVSKLLQNGGETCAICLETLLAPGLRCQRLGCGHTYQRWHTRLYGPCPSNPQSHSALAFDPPRPQQAVPSQEPRRATTPVRSVHTPSPCDVERDAHFEQRIQDSLQFRTQDGNPVSVIMIYLGRGGYMADAAEKAIDLGFPAGVEAVGAIAPTSTDRRWSFGLRGDSYSSERLTTYDEIASALLQENQKASAPSLAGETTPLQEALVGKTRA